MSSPLVPQGDRQTTAPARAPRRAFWADARFAIGLAFVAASIAGVWFVVASARQTVPVLAASSTLVPGQPITAADVSIVEVGLAQAGGAYLPPDALGSGLVALRTVGEGELLPAGATGSSELSDRTSVVVRSSVDVPAGVDRGALVELWETPPGEQPGAFGTPRILVADAVVAGLTREEGVMSSGGASLELVIDRSRVADVLAAVAGGSVLSAVPTTGGAAAPATQAETEQEPGAGEGEEE